MIRILLLTAIILCSRLLYMQVNVPEVKTALCVRTVAGVSTVPETENAGL